MVKYLSQVLGDTEVALVVDMGEELEVVPEEVLVVDTQVLEIQNQIIHS